jgi:hydroxymethylglutaryl-CoA lyase
MAGLFKENLPEKVEFLELLLRDGMQHAESSIHTETKLWYAEYFLRAGYTKIEVTNFGHPKLLVQSRDAEEILEKVHKLKIVQEKKPHLKCYGMTKRAFERAADMAQKGFPPSSVAFTISTEDLHGRRNSGRTREEYLKEIPEFIKIAEANGFAIDMAIACVYGSPCAGPVPIEHTFELMDWGLDNGIKNFTPLTPPASPTPNDPMTIWPPSWIATGNTMMRLSFGSPTSMNAGACRSPTPCPLSWAVPVSLKPH